MKGTRNGNPTSELQAATERTGSDSLRGSMVLRYSLSYRDVEELVQERGLEADHPTIWRWVSGMDRN